MTKISEIKADKRFPSSITSHAIFSTQHEIKKIFPEIGLDNFSEKTFIDNSKEITKSALDVLSSIYKEINNRQYNLTLYGKTKGSGFGDKRKITFQKCISVLKQLSLLLKKSPKKFLVLNDKTGKITVNLPSDISDDGKVIFKKGEGIFKVYNKLTLLLREGLFVGLSPLDQDVSFKKFNNENIPGSESAIIFSSTGIEGAWDIATMSMRGISSCQSWSQSNASHLIGSIVDPCTAIMYMTSGSHHESKGLKMMRRCIVRFALDKTSNKPSLILEKMYPTHNKDVESKFLELLKQKTKGQIQIINLSTCLSCYKAYVPLTPVLSSLEERHRPYRDSGIEFRALPSSHVMLADNVKKQLQKPFITFASKARIAVGKIKATTLTAKIDKDYCKHLRSSYSAPLYSIQSEISCLIASSFNEEINNYKDCKEQPSEVTLKVFDTIFSSSSIDALSNKCIMNFVKHSKVKPSSLFKDLLKDKIKTSLSSETDKFRIKLISKLEKVKNKKQPSLPDDEVLKLINKIS